MSKRKTLTNKLDKYFSLYVRQRNADSSGFVSCFTCGTRKHWKEMDAGHFQSRGKKTTRWDEKNVQVQCKRCNGFRGGEQFKFARELDNLYGQGTALELEQRSNQPFKLTLIELEDLVIHYKRLVS